jgi:hypothetical protein
VGDTLPPFVEESGSAHSSRGVEGDKHLAGNLVTCDHALQPR